MRQVQYLFDENCNGRIVRGVRRRALTLGTLTTEEAGLQNAADSLILEAAATESRVVISHDFRTMKVHAEERLRRNLPMAGLILVRQNYPVGQAIEDLVLIAETTTAEEWHGKIIFLPL